MKRILTLVLCWLIAFTAMAETTLKAKTALSAAGGYVTSLNKVDGSFEDGTTGWVASSGTIVKTASTEFQGNFKGTWTATGAATLDLQWTATASNTYEASMMFKSPVADSDHYICAIVNGTETGCKLVDGPDYRVNSIRKISVVADSVMSSSFYLRLKHTGSDAFTVDVDDGKIEPWTPQAVNLAEQGFARHAQLASTLVQNTGGSDLGFNLSNIEYSDSFLQMFTVVNESNATKFYAKKSVTVIAAINGYSSSLAAEFVIRKNGATYFGGNQVSTTNYDTSVATPIKLSAGDYFTFYIPFTLNAVSTVRFSITASAISDNVVQSWQPSGSLGELKFLPQNIAPQGFIPALGSSIGKTAGTYQGDAYYDLYKVLWTQSSVTAGEPYVISSAKGADAATDWAANKTITIDVSGLVVRAYKSGTTGAVGAKQLDAFQGHEHRIGYYSTAGSRTDSFVQANDITNWSTNTNLQSGYNDDGSGTPRTASETRMTNIAQYAFIRYGNDAPTLLALPASKENRFEITVNANGTIANGNTSLITVTKTGTGLYTIGYSALGLTKAPIVKMEELGTYNMFGVAYPRFRDILTTTATQTTVRTGYNSGGTGTADDVPFVFTIIKANSDYTAPGVFISNLNPDGFNRTNGTTGLINNFSFSYGTTNATTVCSDSPCSYLDQIGNYGTSVTRISTGQYSVNFGKTFTKLKCNSNVYQAAATGSKQAPPIRCENCSSISFETNIPQVAYYDTYGTLVCQGY